MFKRVLLAVTFVAALGAASLATTRFASAHGCGYSPYGVGYGGGFYPTYATTYYGNPYRPMVLRSAPAYPVYYGGYGPVHRHRAYRPGGVVVSFGF